MIPGVATTQQPGTGADAAATREPEMPKVVVRDASCVYTRRRGHPIVAVERLDMEIAAGEFVSVVGPSGCGKSTLLRVLAGLRPPSRGTVELRPESRARPLTATVFQEYSIFPWRTVLGNVRLGLDAAGLPRRDANARARDWIDRVGLSGFVDAFPHSLSGGMKQRVALARALVLEPEVLLMDEPFAALDAQLRKILQDELLRICEEHRYTVVFVTHSLEEAILLSDRIVLMTARPGRVKQEYRVPFARPRAATLRGEPEFARLEEEIWQDLRSEVEQAVPEGGDRG